MIRKCWLHQGIVKTKHELEWQANLNIHDVIYKVTEQNSNYLSKWNPVENYLRSEFTMYTHCRHHVLWYENQRIRAIDTVRCLQSFSGNPPLRLFLLNVDTQQLPSRANLFPRPRIAVFEATATTQVHSAGVHQRADC